MEVFHRLSQGHLRVSFLIPPSFSLAAAVCLLPVPFFLILLLFLNSLYLFSPLLSSPSLLFLFPLPPFSSST